MEELYLEKFFKKGERGRCEVEAQKAPEVAEEKSFSRAESQLSFFLRLFKENCRKYLGKAPYLSGGLKNLEDAIEASQYDRVLIIIDELEDLLDIAHRGNS